MALCYLHVVNIMQYVMIMSRITKYNAVVNINIDGVLELPITQSLPK